MSAPYFAIRDLEPKSQISNQFKAGDVLVLFGELFQRGYATGLVEEAEKRGMKIVRTTVGRREKDGSLRALTTEEAALVPKPFINIPLEAGFDLETDDSGKPILDYVKDVKLSEWETAQVPEASIKAAQKKGRERFQKNLSLYLAELEKEIPKGANVLFAHLMAGGVPRVKIIMPLMNRALKGTGDRFILSSQFWNSHLGRLCDVSFKEVTAETFASLVRDSKNLREKIQGAGGNVSYIAYGYHGTEVLIGNEYRWQSYSPYLQGWAKKALEDYSREFSKQGLNTCVYNCPEILTNSSAIFSGVEVSLYPLLGALDKQGQNSAKVQAFMKNCLSQLKDGFSLPEMMKMTTEYLNSDLIRSHCDFEQWPQHNSKDQLEKMLSASEQLIEMHKDPKQLITFALSEVVFEGCGQVMITDSFKPASPVAWINHDIIVKLYVG